MPQRGNVQIARSAFVTMATPLGISCCLVHLEIEGGVRRDGETGTPEQKAKVSMRKPLGLTGDWVSFG